MPVWSAEITGISGHEISYSYICAESKSYFLECSFLKSNVMSHSNSPLVFLLGLVSLGVGFWFLWVFVVFFFIKTIALYFQF